MVHGKQHNCGAFDRLIGLFKKTYNVVAIDLPSHGRSSHFPPGSPLQLTQFVLALKRVTQYLNWEKFSLIGHSFGGQTGTYYSAIFPQQVQSLVVIDTMEPRPVPLQDTFTYLQSTLQDQLRLEDKLSVKTPPVYTYEEAYDKIKKNMSWELIDEAARDLIKRAVIEVDGGFAFTSDQRLKYPMRPIFTFEQQKEIVDKIQCPVLFLLADGNMDRYGTYLKDMYEFNSSRSNTTIVVVEGDHAVHQNYPERISDVIEEFITFKKLNKGVTKSSQNGVR